MMASHHLGGSTLWASNPRQSAASATVGTSPIYASPSSLFNAGNPATKGMMLVGQNRTGLGCVDPSCLCERSTFQDTVPLRHPTTDYGLGDSACSLHAATSISKEGTETGAYRPLPAACAAFLGYLIGCAASYGSSRKLIQCEKTTKPG
jgi:hypothetical protein